MTARENIGTFGNDNSSVADGQKDIFSEFDVSDVPTGDGVMKRFSSSLTLRTK